MTDFKEYRARHTVNTIPFTNELPQKEADSVPIGNFSSKKITIVGMGQVRACARERAYILLFV